MLCATAFYYLGLNRFFIFPAKIHHPEFANFCSGFDLCELCELKSSHLYQERDKSFLSILDLWKTTAPSEEALNLGTVHHPLHKHPLVLSQGPYLAFNCDVCKGAI